MACLKCPGQRSHYSNNILYLLYSSVIFLLNLAYLAVMCVCQFACMLIHFCVINLSTGSFQTTTLAKKCCHSLWRVPIVMKDAHGKDKSDIWRLNTELIYLIFVTQFSSELNMLEGSTEDCKIKLIISK